MLQSAAFAEVVICFIAWALAFADVRRRAAGQRKVVRAPVSRWGILLQCLAFALDWVKIRPETPEKSAPSLIAAMILAPLSAALGWWATRHLGKQWRYEAALSEDHDLIQSGPYAYVRHPIYASMLGLLISIGAVRTRWPLFLAALVLFLIGIEIRVRAEDRLLANRFGESFEAYRARVRAYIPFVR
jgi:protein-S-isoprenylcysteine O-methyltransferase Ste14